MYVNCYLCVRSFVLPMCPGRTHPSPLPYLGEGIFLKLVPLMYAPLAVRLFRYKSIKADPPRFKISLQIDYEKIKSLKD